MKRLILFFSLLLLVVPVKAAKFDMQISRIAGKNRYDTSIGVSKYSYDRSDNVIIANGSSFPDALSGAALSSSLDCPILLSDKDSISNDLVREIARLKPRKIFILGSTGAISEKAEDQLSALAKVERIGGENRYETSAKIASRVLEINATTEVGLASGVNFPDALTASSYLTSKNVPLLLTDPFNLAGPTEDFLTTRPITRLTLFGGENSVSQSIFDGSLASFADYKRIAGENRFDTAIKIAEDSFADFSDLILVNASNFPDALSSSAIVKTKGAPIMLVDRDSIPDQVKDFILETRPQNITIVGGTNSVSNEVVAELWDLSSADDEEDLGLEPDSYNYDYAGEIYSLVDEKRRERSLPGLNWSEELAKAAKTRAKELSLIQDAYTRPDGSAWNTVSDKAKGQSIAVLRARPGDVLNGIIESSKDGGNIFKDRSDFEALGTAVYTDKLGNTYWVLIFGLDG